MKLKIYSIVITIILIAAFLFGLLLLFVLNYATPSKISEFKDFSGKDNQYQLWYADNGDLIFKKPLGNPELKYRDYYGPTKVKQHKWLNKNTLKITLEGGPKLGTVIVTVQIPLLEIQHQP